MKADRNKLRKLFEKHHSKTMELYATLGLSASDVETLIDEYLDLHVKRINRALRTAHFHVEPTHIEL